VTERSLLESDQCVVRSYQQDALLRLAEAAAMLKVGATTVHEAKTILREGTGRSRSRR